MSDSLIACPKCGARYDGTRVRPGAKVRCRKCKTVFEATVPVFPPKPKPDKLVGRKIGGYEVLSKIGVGGIGAVYKARQLSLDRIVAFKTLKPEFAQNEAFITRLKREARSSAQISHSNIVQTYDVGQDQGVSFIAMEFVEGQTLQDKLSREGGVQVEFAVDVLEQAAKALAFAYQAGIVHRDIKPDNLMITTDGTIKVADFGLAKRIDVDVSLTQSGTIVGTPRYMSPEQGNGDPLDFRSDIYSLGASIYHALAGVPPFDAPTAMAVIVKHINDPLPPLRAMAPQVPPKLARVIERMMAKDPADRYQTPDDLLAAAADVKATLAEDIAAVERGEVEDETVVVDPTARTQPAVTKPVKVKTRARRRGRRAVVWALAALGVAVVLLVVAQVVRDREREAEIAADLQQRIAAAQDFHNEERFQDAINAFDGFPPDGAPNCEMWKAKAQEQRDRYLGLARKKFEIQASKAEAAVENQEFSQAQAVYEDILESFGVPTIVDEAKQRLDKVLAKQEKAVNQVVTKLEREIRTKGSDSAAAQDLYSKIRVLKGDTRLSAPLEERLEKVAERIREERGGAKILYVSKKGKGDYRSVDEALHKIFKDDTIEIRDSEVYEEPHLVSSVRNVTLRGAAGQSPVIRPRFSGGGGKGGGLHDLLLRLPAVRMGRGCTLENLIFDFSRTSGGILLQGDGDSTLRSCAILGIRTFGVAVGAKLGPGKAEGPGTLKVTDCIFTAVRGMGRGGPPPPRVIALNYSEGQRIDLEFTHNVVCGGVVFTVRPIGNAKSRLVVDSNIFESNALLTLSMGSTVRSPRTFFDYNCYSNGPKDFYGEMPELRGRFRRPFHMMDVVGRVTRFEAWCERTKGDRHSILKPAGLRNPESGDFRLAADSPCLARGRDKSDIGLLTGRSLLRNLFPGGGKKAEHKSVSRSERPARKDMERGEARIKDLLEQQRYDQAIKAVQDVMQGTPNARRRIHNIDLMKALKSLVVDRINSGAKPPLPQPLVKRDVYAHLTGGSIVSATDDSFVATDKTDSMRTTIPWATLTGEEFIAIAKSKECTDIQDGHQQLMLGVYCFELKLWDKAQTYLRYAKNSMNSSELDRRMAVDLLDMAEGVAQKENERGAGAPKGAASDTLSDVDGYTKIQEYFEEKRYKSALDLANAYVNRHAKDVQLRLRVGNVLWENFRSTWKNNRDSVPHDVRTRWVKMIWKLLSSGVEEGGKVAGQQHAQEVLTKLAAMAKKMGVALPVETQKRGAKNGG
ncbi:MAG: protein kinase [Planctomycetes bacterium]|nr:protein kinase [Planctomycetota bacterium]